MNIVRIARRFVREEWGGTETCILETSKCLLNKGHRTEVFCPNALAVRNREEIQGINVTRTPFFYPYIGLSGDSKHAMDKKGGNLFSFSMMWQLARYPKLDVLHAHTQKRLGGIVRYIAQKRNVPYVVSLHGGIHDVPREEAATWIAPTKGSVEWGKALGWWVGSRRVLDDAAAIICVGKREQELTKREYPNKRVIYLPNGVDNDKFERGDARRFREHFEIPPAAKVITVVGRIDVQKNQKLAVRAMPALLERDPNVHLVLIGHVTNQPYLNELKEMIQSLHLQRRVTIIPGLDPATGTLVDAYHGSDIFLLPSTHEPFGIVVLEAWASQLPVVAAAVGGVRNLVDHESDGLLFESDDDVGLVDALTGLLRNPQRAAELAAAGHAKAVGEYSWRRVTDRLLDIYSEVKN
ncbi:MAG: glycosyltransferase family 4 protein [Pirellulaceae bacterium]|nr:glycosyltransferase family 4 protein [Pirellulaceae bacterium]